MVVAGIFVTSMVVLMGSLIAVMRTSEVADLRIAATSFNRNVLENLRILNLERDDLLTYDVNSPAAPLIPGVPDGTVQVWAVDAAGVRFQLPVADPAVIPGPPDPVEIQVITLVPRGLGVGLEYSFRTSTMLTWD